MTSRPLTSGERNIAASMFGRSIDYDAVYVIRRKWWPFHSRDIAMAPDGNLWFHPESGLCQDDFSCAALNLQGLFIHEMTHVWQAQRGGRWFLPLARHPFCRYDYALVEGRPFRRYGLEQQAEIVKHAFLLRAGVKLARVETLAEYEAILPFG